MSIVAKNIKKYREMLGITQEELADRLSVTRQAVSGWETGRNNPDIETLQRLSVVFDCEIDEFINEGKQPSYERFQKKYIRWSVASGAICVLILLSFAIFGPRLKYIQRIKYIPYWHAFRMFIIPAGFFAFGILLISLVSMSTSTVLKKGKRILCLCIAAFLIISFLLLMAEWIMILFRIDTPQLIFRIIGGPIIMGYGEVLFLKLFPTLAGILLFLGINNG